ncbi:MAG: DUF3159 domain-containing protein [Actinomycetes bacterium]
MENKDSLGEKELLDKALGGWRGLVDSALPSLLFVLIFVVQKDLNLALITSVVAGVILFVIRLFEKKSLTQVIGGFFGLLFSVFLTWRTNDASNFFLTGIITNLVYGIVLFISLIVRRPLLGYLVGSLVGNTSGWLQDQLLVRAYTTITWIWVGVFSIRVGVQVPLYLADNIAVLGPIKIFMGWPLYLFAAWISYRIVQTARSKS